MKIPAKYRKVIYVGATLLLALSLAAGWFTAEEMTNITNSVVAIIGALATLLASFNVTPDDDGSQ